MHIAPHALAEQILELPDAALQAQYIQSVLENEKERRMQFYEWVTEEVKAEFINGEVIVHSPVKRRHWNTSALLSRLLGFYTSVKKLGQVGTEKVMISLTRNDYEPDIVFFSSEKVAMFTEDQVLFPAPDFVVEILSKKTASIDRGIKKRDYASHGIREYWIIDPVKTRIEQFVLASGSSVYFPAKIHQCGETIESSAIEGFVIPVEAVFDEVANLAAMQQFMQQ